MSIAVWPVELPPSAMWRWTKVPDNNLVSGPNDKTRRRYANSRKSYSLSSILTADQLEIFLTFWEEGIADGALKFEWEKPEDQTTANFIPLPGGYQQQHLGNGDTPIYRITFSVKKVP